MVIPTYFATSDGAIAYTDQEVEKLRQTAIANFTQAGYGGIIKTTDTNYGTIGATWVTVDNWDEASVLQSKGVGQNVAGSGLQFTRQGIFSISIALSVSFTDVNQGRVFSVRLFNSTDAAPGVATDIFVGRNQAGVNIAIPGLLVEIGAPQINDLFWIQIAGLVDTFADTTVIQASFTAVQVSSAITLD